MCAWRCDSISLGVAELLVITPSCSSCHHCEGGCDSYFRACQWHIHAKHSIHALFRQHLRNKTNPWATMTALSVWVTVALRSSIQLSHVWCQVVHRSRESASDSCLGTVQCVLIITGSEHLQLVIWVRFESKLGFKPACFFLYCHEAVSLKWPILSQQTYWRSSSAPSPFVGLKFTATPYSPGWPHTTHREASLY